MAIFTAAWSFSEGTTCVHPLTAAVGYRYVYGMCMCLVVRSQVRVANRISRRSQERATR